MNKEAYSNILKALGDSTKLIAVSKTKPNEDIQAFYDAGQRHFGENKVQELVDKAEALPKDIHWHMIGHLQRNKVKYIAPFVHLIHGVDSKRLLVEINKQGKKIGRVIDCLLQFHIAQEDSKFGFSFDEAKELLESDDFVEMEFVNVRGVMGMATNTDNTEQVRQEFRNLHDYFQVLKSHFFTFNNDFSEISMGMSGDYELAVEEGSTMVRVGSLLFGERNYSN